MYQPLKALNIAGRMVGPDHPTYFVADIAANHDGDLNRAIALIHLAAEAGADAAKFQHFEAHTIVSDFGFKAMGRNISHQTHWDKSVFEVYRAASVDLGWTADLKQACGEAGVTFFTSPYSMELVDAMDPFVPAYKIGSGDITWLEIIERVARKNKPYLLATGASTMTDVDRAVGAALAINPQLALLQCNTNYTASVANFRFIQLNTLKTYQKKYPDMVLGLSDHTPGHTTVLGAVALGARIVEKHFTDDTQRTGPDHAFSMDPRSWKEMVERTRELENALGTGAKRVEANEEETVVLQRRALRARTDLLVGTTLSSDLLTVLRPAPSDCIPPYEISKVIGKTILRALRAGEHLQWTDLK
jgi:N-acetylneuraminate synthase